jgi:hypothetical protein
MNRPIIFFLVTTCLFSACRPELILKEDDVLVKVHGNSLHRSEVEKIIPSNLSSSDSFLIAENYINKWIKDVLTFEVAKRNIGREELEINRLVEEYRRSLLRHRYQEYMIRNRLTAEIREYEKVAYYKDNIHKFVLEKNLIKGLFLKIPAESPGLKDVKKWYKSIDPEDLENIEKYSIQNASIYDYFYDQWIDFDEMIDKIPIQVSNKSQYLKDNQTVEVSDSIYYYLLNISEYLLAGNVAPYEYADVQIQEMMINKRKMDFLKTLEEELYQDAIRKGEVIFVSNQK